MSQEKKALKKAVEKVLSCYSVLDFEYAIKDWFNFYINEPKSINYPTNLFRDTYFDFDFILHQNFNSIILPMLKSTISKKYNILLS
ncbi:MAG: hypothetical protein QXP36_09205 [Conexivisphaerales archaeon]